MNKQDLENSVERDTWDALESAFQIFGQHLSNCGYDPAYWDIKFTAYIVDNSLENRLARIEYERELKGGEGQRKAGKK